MSSVESYILVGNKFVPPSRIEPPLPTEFYIDGMIECTVSGRRILTRRETDLVDQLWSYIVEGLTLLRKGQIYDSYFPDQPLRLRFTPNGDWVVVEIGNESHRVLMAEFISTMSQGAEVFFIEMKRLLPSACATWDMLLKKIASVK